MGKEWRPNPRQEDFISLPDSIFEGFYGGAAGGGKSDVLMMLPIVREFYQNSKFKGIIFRRTFPELEESLITRSRQGIGLNGPSYYDFGAKYNDTKHVWTFPSGAMIRFSFLENIGDARSHDTAEYSYAAFDELTAFNEDEYVYISSRVRSGDQSIPPIMRSASNPGNIGHGWVLNRFVRPNKKGYKILYDEFSRTKRIFIPAKLSDNPHLALTDPGYEHRLNLLPEADRKAKKDGDWFVFAGQVFLEYRPNKRHNEAENAIHVIDPIEIPDWWPRIVALDWGYSAMTYALWAAISPQERVYCYREFSVKKTSIDIWGAEIGRICHLDPPLAGLYMDPSANQNRGQGTSIKQQFMTASGINGVIDANNDRISGKMLIHDYLRFEQRPKKFIPKEGRNQEMFDKIYRIYGANAAAEYNAMFTLQEDETNIPKIQIFNSCPILINAIPLCIHDETHPEDIAEFDGDDPIDTLRYLLKACNQHTTGLKSEYEKRRVLQEILDQHKTSGDTTRFYRRMEHYETNNPTVKPVYH